MRIADELTRPVKPCRDLLPEKVHLAPGRRPLMRVGAQHHAGDPELGRTGESVEILSLGRCRDRPRRSLCRSSNTRRERRRTVRSSRPAACLHQHRVIALGLDNRDWQPGLMLGHVVVPQRMRSAVFAPDGDDAAVRDRVLRLDLIVRPAGSLQTREDVVPTRCPFRGDRCHTRSVTPVVWIRPHSALRPWRRWRGANSLRRWLMRHMAPVAWPRSRLADLLSDLRRRPGRGPTASHEVSRSACSHWVSTPISVPDRSARDCKSELVFA